MIDEFKETLKLLSDRKNKLFDKISSSNYQEEKKLKNMKIYKWR